MEKIRRLFRGAAGDSLFLSFVKIVTAVFGLFTAKLLSKYFSLQEYGTYSQAMLVVSIAYTICRLGLSEAINYFYNSSSEELEKQQTVSTIFGIECAFGSLTALAICLFSGAIVRYFGNEDLRPFLFFAAFMPMLENLAPMLQVLVISIGKARSVAVRNFVFSLCRLLFVLIASFVTGSIRTVFILLLVFDVAQVVFFYLVFSRSSFSLSFSHFRKDLILPILRFSLLMTLFVLTKNLNLDVDKLVISYFTDTETLAIYSNAAKLLPFDMVSLAFMTVLVPIITRMIRGERHEEALQCLRAYIRVGYLFTGILVTGGLICAREMMLLLYDAKYLPGLPVFIVYLLVDLVQYANLSIVLTARGKTGTLLVVSASALAVNFVLDIVSYHFFGLIGPALATLLVTIAMMAVFIVLSAREIQVPVGALFDGREILTVALELVCLGAAARLLKGVLLSFFPGYLPALILTFGLFCAVLLLLNRKRIVSVLTEINCFR